MLGEWEEREAKAFDPFYLGPLHAPTLRQLSLHART